MLTCFILVAVLAPVLADPDGLEVTKATGGVLAAAVRRSTRWAPTRTAARC